MDSDPSGDTAMVCGATGALGRAVVDHFLARGDDVIAVARRSEELGHLAETNGERVRVRAEEADLVDPDSVAALWERLDADGIVPRWLVDVVGGYRAGTVEDISPEEYDFARGLNLDSAWWTARSALPRMRDVDGCMVLISGRAAYTGGTESAAYTVAKAALLRLTEVLAADVLTGRLRVNAVLPAIMDTPGNADASDAMKAAAVPPADVAAVIGFLCSDAARPITGAAIPAYGRFPKPYPRREG